MMATHTPKSALLIAGPTASGKSAWALETALARKGVIINADSMQVYRELRVLSARPAPAEEALAPHRLYGHVSGAEDYSVARWLAEAKAEMNFAWEQGLLPIICGGTGLYFKALEEGLSEIPPIDPAVRQKWRDFDGDLHAALSRLDPEMAVRLNPADRQRLVRALEVKESTGSSLATWQASAGKDAFLSNINVERVFLDMPREVLHQRVEARFDAMMAAGALEEVRALPELDERRPMMRAIGVPELRLHLVGQIGLDEAIARAKTATRNYIKRQSTWWRGQMKRWPASSVK